jgi:short-subunit dehydrogenase
METPKKPIGKALVTGASEGIGLAVAKRLTARGFEVWLAARREALLAEVARGIAKAGGIAHPYRLDVTDPDRTVEAVAALDDEVGGFDLVVANAGVGEYEPAARMSWPVTRAMLMTNIVGAIATLTPFVPRMLARGRGHLVGISSLAADIPVGAAVYGATKAALTYFLLTLRPEVVHRGVHVTAVHPGFVRTAMTAKNTTPMPLLLEPEAAAAIIDRAIRRKVALLRFPWRMGLVVRLARLLPRPLREALARRLSAPE